MGEARRVILVIRINVKTIQRPENLDSFTRKDEIENHHHEREIVDSQSLDFSLVLLWLVAQLDRDVNAL